MPLRTVVVCCAVLACGLVKPAVAQSAAEAQAKRNAGEAYTQANAMVFAVARGGADSCGSGCSEWIAAEGTFDKGVEKRFRNFLGTLKGRQLPIYFNSIGGIIGESRVIGRLLRARRMTASVGETVPEGCRSGRAADASCRQIMQSDSALKAQLRTAGAMCHSACVYALIGASVRVIPPGALLGIHSSAPSTTSIALSQRPGAPTAEQLLAGRRKYVRDMGVDPTLVDLAQTVPSDKLHILSRDEIARFGIETRGAAGAR